MNILQNNSVQNIVQFKEQYNCIVQKIVQARKNAGLSQQFVAEWLNVDRRKIIQFEKANTFDIITLLLYSDKLSIEIELMHTVN